MDLDFTSAGLLSPASFARKQESIERLPVSLVSYLNTKPLIYGLERDLIKHRFEMRRDVPAVCARRLTDGEVELGIIPSIEFVKGRGNWKIVPDLCIASRSTVTSVNLFFKSGLHKLNTIALDTSSRTSVALLKILLREKYQLSPDFIEMSPDLDLMLEQADAALIIGDKALNYQVNHKNYIDLGEEWHDMTGLPFVYAFWAGHEYSLTPPDVLAILGSYQLGKKHLPEIAREFARNQPHGWELYYNYLDQHICYSFGGNEQNGLLEFYNYAFFHGLIGHIPELSFYEY